MFKKILITAAIALALFLAVAALQPPDYQVTRTVSIAAPPAKIFAIVNDMHRWNDWSPWAKLDPDMKTTYEGPASGVGASESWTGNSKVGEGKMTLTQSKPGELVTFQLDFFKPMQATNTVDFGFKPEGQGTAVSWTMHGRKNLISKAFGLVVSMDRIVGADFEKGLANLKAMAEAPKK